MYKIKVTLIDDIHYDVDLLLPQIPVKGNDITCTLYKGTEDYWGVFEIVDVIYTFNSNNEFSHISIMVKER
jgi:hypothetical protein